MTSHEDLQAAIDHITNADGYINLLVNNAGISTPNLGSTVTRPTPKWSLPRLREYWFNRSFADYGAVMETNTIAHFIVSFAFLELLDQGNRIREREAAELERLREAEAKLAANGLNGVNATNGAGSKRKLKMRNYVSSQIVTTSSIGGFGRDNAAFIYNASKAATTHMMKQLATYLIPWGIRSNVICPGCKSLFLSSSLTLLVLTQNSLAYGDDGGHGARCQLGGDGGAQELDSGAALWDGA